MKAIAEIPVNPLPPVNPSQLAPAAEWGLWGAIAFLVVREGFKWFNSKEANESRLLHSLIENLQSSQSRLLEQLVEVQANTNTAINGLKTAVEQLGQQIRAETSQIAQANQAAIREVNARIDRLDKGSSDE